MALGAVNDPYLLKRNDTRPRIRMYLRQGAGAGTPIDLTNATAVVFNMRPAGSEVPKISRADASIVTANAGLVQYTPTSSDTDTPGDFLAEFEITFSDGGVLTVPEGNDWIYITVGKDIA